MSTTTTATATMDDVNNERWVIVTTEYRGVYFGRIVEHADRECILADARMAIRWGTSHGVDELAATGPTERSKIGALAPRVWLCGLTSVSDCTATAVKRWHV